MFRNDRYICNKQVNYIPAHLNFGKFILDAIREHPKHDIAVINGKSDAKLTYGELTQYAVDLAATLVQLGVCPGDTVAICIENRNEFLPIVIGVSFTGATTTPLDLKVGAAQLKHRLELSKPNYIIISKTFWNTYKNILKDLDFKKYIKIDDIEMDSEIPTENFTLKNYSVDQFEPAKVEGQKDIALIFYSSGSTGYSKGIMWTHVMCISNSLICSFKDPTLKTAICNGKWCHIYNLMMTLKFLVAGRTMVYYDGILDVFLNCVEKYKVDIAFTRPSFIYEFLASKNLQKYNLNSLQYTYCGTSCLSEKVKHEFLKKLPKLKTFVNGYGMSETFELTSESWGVPGLKPNTVGKPSPGITIKVVDLSTMETLGPNQKGEICIDAFNLFKGYIGLDPSTYLDKEGFLRTGDLGYYDEDGYFYIIDRIKEIISYCGHKIYPMEIELILLNYPGVKDVGVVGNPVPELGEEPIAFIVKQPDSTITKAELIEYFSYEATSYVKLRKIHFVQEIPRNSMGKIMRPNLKKMLNAYI